MSQRDWTATSPPCKWLQTAIALYKGLLKPLGSSVVAGQRKLAGRKRFWEKWAKEHRKIIKKVEEHVGVLKSLAIVSHSKSGRSTSDNLLSPLQLKSNCVCRRGKEAHLMIQHMHWLQT
jgi:hypothetical protein